MNTDPCIANQISKKRAYAPNSYHINRSEGLKHNKKKVLYVIMKILDKRKNKKRPKELKILYIARTVRLTYKQTRLIINKLVEQGSIEKYTSWDRKDGKYIKKCWYRLKNDKLIGKI